MAAASGSQPAPQAGDGVGGNLRPRLTPAQFLTAHLGSTHPLFAAPTAAASTAVPTTPKQQMSASAYILDGKATSALMRSIWTSLLTSLPSPANILPTRAVQLTTIEAVLDFLEKHDWRLSEAQKAAAKIAEEANRKGKAVERGGNTQRAQGRGFAVGPEYGPDRKGMPCGHIFKKGEAIYRCR